MNDAGKISWIYNDGVSQVSNVKKFSTDFISEKVTEEVINFHRSFPEYSITPLHSLDRLAKNFNVGKIWIKDEAYRFGLNAFKGLGGSYAIGKYLCEKLDLDMHAVSFEMLSSQVVKDKIGQITFVTATDGNHGRGVAWAANQLGHKAVVYMPEGSALTRLENIKAEGAQATITDLNYDDTVRFASEQAEKNGWVLVQDTAWNGYEKIPTWIMQGYSTIITEAIEQITQEGYDKPTHVFLQAGVGSFAGSMLGYLVSKFGNKRPFTIVVEPDQAACLYKSIAAGDGNPHAVTGNLSTIMAGLACGEPSTVSWGILKSYAEMFVACPDYVSACGMRILSSPLGGDPRVISGESGAVGLGLLRLLAENKNLKSMSDKLKLSPASKILIISTEGDTDPVGYRNIVWNGAYPCMGEDSIDK